MSVYVDDMRAPYGRMVLCHMIADTSEELYDMAEKIGVAQHWVQDKGTWREHFDVSLGCRAKALQLGAQQLTQRELSLRIQARRPSTDV